MVTIQKYFPDLPEDKIRQLTQLEKIYTEWNERINVVSRKDITHLYEHHILHSLAIAKVISFTPGSTVLDAGTGGGFPGIPLAILFPDVQFHLVDSVGKKIRVVEGVTGELNLSNVIPWQNRIEELRGKYDFVVCRAVTSFPTIVSWVTGLFSIEDRNPLPNGILYLKGGDLMEELKDYAEKVTVFRIGDFFEEPFFATKKIVFLPATSMRDL